MERTKIAVKVDTRGQTSKFYCSFLKIDLSFSSDAASLAVIQNSPFAGIKKLKLNTHCAPKVMISGQELVENTLTRFGRLVSDNSVFRERVMYQIFQNLTEFSLKTANAIVTYNDSENTLSPAIIKPAFVIETAGSLELRLGIKENESEAAFNDYDINSVALNFLFQQLILNDDWTLGMLMSNSAFQAPPPPGGIALGGMLPLRTYKAFRKNSEPLLAVTRDFAIAVLVTGASFGAEGERSDQQDIDFYPTTEHQNRIKIFRATFQADVAKKAASLLQSQKETILAAIEKASLDREGRAMMAKRVRTFFNFLA